LRAARANRVFCTDEKRIRTENTVIDKSNKRLGLSLYKIAEFELLGWRLLSALISGIIVAFCGSYTRTVPKE